MSRNKTGVAKDDKPKNSYDPVDDIPEQLKYHDIVEINLTVISHGDLLA